MRIGACHYDRSTREIRCGGRTTSLEPKHAAVLEVLLAYRGAVVPRETLLDLVWNETHVTDEVVTNAIANLRRALGDSARRQSLIRTIPKKGYLLIEAAESRSASSPRRLGSIAAAAVVLLVASVILSHRAATAEHETLDRISRAGEEHPAAYWVDVARARWELVVDGDLSRELGLPLVSSAAERALAVDEQTAEAWALLGMVEAMEWRWSDARRNFERSLRHDPDAETASSGLAELYLLTGRPARARQLAHAALERRPRSAKLLQTLALTQLMSGDRDDALATYGRILEILPGDERATRSIEKLASAEPKMTEISAEAVERLLGNEPVRPAIVAGMFAEAGEPDRALRWLERARDEKDHSLLLVRYDPRWRTLLSDRRYQRILEDVVAETDA